MRWGWVPCFFTLMLLVGLLGGQVQARYYESPPRLESLTPEEQELLRKVQSLIEPTTEEKIMYHYGGAAPCEKLNEAGSYTGAIQEKYSRLRANSRAVAGHGVYVAGNPSSSSTYFKGGITQVVIETGTPMIDLTRPDIMVRMDALGLEMDDVYNLPVDAVVRYNAQYDWYAIKGPTGVRFRALDISKTSPGDLGQLIRELGTSLHNSPESTRVVQAAIGELKKRGGDLSAAWRELGKGLPQTWSVLREFPTEVRLQALDSLLTSRQLLDGFRASKVDGYSKRPEREAVRELSTSILEELGARLDAGQELSDLEIKRLVFVSGVEGVMDWKLADTVRRLPPAQQSRLVELLEGLLDGYKPGKRTGYFPDPHGLEPMARLISALGASDGARVPASADGSVPGVQALADRYLTLMKEQYRKPSTQLPALPKSQMQAVCNLLLRRTLSTLTDQVMPLAVPAGVVYVGVQGLQYVSRMDRQAQLTHTRGLCTAGGGTFGRDRSGGIGYCDCGGGVRVSFSKWEELPKRGDQRPLCARSQ